jgi:hypothetical protein
MSDSEALGGHKRVNFIGAPNFFNLNHACVMLREAFGTHSYLVGSALNRRDFRDVDVRCILPDDKYDAMFPGILRNQGLHPLWSLMCAAISEWLSSRTGLPIDFQIQRQSDCNEDYPHQPRSALGMFVWKNDAREVEK